MRKLRKNEEMEGDSLSTVAHSLFPFPISKFCHIFSQNVKNGTFVANVTKKLNILAEIILGGIRCKEAPQVVPA